MNNAEAFTIRYADLADRPAADAIHGAAYPNDRYKYANNIGVLGTINLVAVIGDQVVGFVSALVNHPNPNGRCLWERMRPYIGFVGVSEECRRSGVGRTLIVEASRLALRMTGESCIYLECESANESAQKLYGKIGFKIVDSEEIEKTFGRPPHSESLVYRGENYMFQSGESIGTDIVQTKVVQD